MDHDAMVAKGPPYPSTVAGIGGKPTVIPDIPVEAVFTLLYVGAAVGNMTTLQINRRRGHKFILNGLLFGFSMSRILTCALRMALATHPNNVSLAIAANIFLTAGILIVYVVNLLFAQRIIRAWQPSVGWHPALRGFFAILFVGIAVFLILLITFIVYSSYTLDPYWHTVSRRIQLGASTYFVVLAATPLIILAVSFALPVSPNAEAFGHGSLIGKALILGVASTLCVLGAGFKAGITWEPPRPLDDAPWYDSKACLYVFYFGLEILILYWYLAMRIDKRFHVPNGSSKRKTYIVEGMGSAGLPVTSSSYSLHMPTEEKEREADEKGDKYDKDDKDEKDADD